MDKAQRSQFGCRLVTSASTTGCAFFDGTLALTSADNYLAYPHDGDFVFDVDKGMV